MFQKCRCRDKGKTPRFPPPAYIETDYVLMDITINSLEIVECALEAPDILIAWPRTMKPPMDEHHDVLRLSCRRDKRESLLHLTTILKIPLLINLHIDDGNAELGGCMQFRA